VKKKVSSIKNTLENYHYKTHSEELFSSHFWTFTTFTETVLKKGYTLQSDLHFIWHTKFVIKVTKCHCSLSLSLSLSSTHTHKRACTHAHTHTYLLTYLHTYSVEQSPSWEANQFQLVKKFPPFYGNQWSNTTFTRASHLSLFWASLIQSIPAHTPLPEDPSCCACTHTHTHTHTHTVAY